MDKSCSKIFIWNKIVCFDWCYWCCMDPLRFRTYYTGLVCGLRVRVWTVAGLDSMIKCGFLYVKLWNMIVIPLVKKRLCLVSSYQIQTGSEYIEDVEDCWSLKIYNLGGVHCSWLYKVNLTGIVCISAWFMMILWFLSLLNWNMGNLAKGFDCIEELIKLFLRYKTYMRWNMVCTKGRWGGLTERNRWDKPIKVTIIISMNLLYCWKAFPPGLETSRRETDVDKKNLTNMCGLVFTQKLGFSSNTNQSLIILVTMLRVGLHGA